MCYHDDLVNQPDEFDNDDIIDATYERDEEPDYDSDVSDEEDSLDYIEREDWDAAEDDDEADD